MAKYDSVLLRQNLQDSGTIPRTGGWTASPDLIAAGIQPISNPQATFAAAASYGSDPTQPVVFNAPNYVYLRGKNLGTAATTAEARVFYAPQSLFLYPIQWLDNAMKTAQGATFSSLASIAPNAIGVTTDPLVWTPAPTSEHYCLVGFLSTPAHPFESQKPSNAFTSMDDLAAWIGKNGGTGWHNVQFTSAGAPTFSKSTVYPASSTAARVQFALTALDCPVGSQIAFSCGTPLPGGRVINLPPVTVTKSDQFGVVLEYDVPAGWTSSITYSYNANGKPAGKNFNLSMSAAIKETIPGGHAFSQYARHASEVYAFHQAVDVDGLENGKLLLGDMPVSKLIPVGSDTTLLIP